MCWPLALARSISPRTSAEMFSEIRAMSSPSEGWVPPAPRGGVAEADGVPLNVLGCLDTMDAGSYQLQGQEIDQLSADALTRVAAAGAIRKSQTKRSFCAVF